MGSTSFHVVTASHTQHCCSYSCEVKFMPSSTLTSSTDEFNNAKHRYHTVRTLRALVEWRGPGRQPCYDAARPAAPPLRPARACCAASSSGSSSAQKKRGDAGSTMETSTGMPGPMVDLMKALLK